jgi:hypothetical protein
MNRKARSIVAAALVVMFGSAVLAQAAAAMKLAPCGLHLLLP